ncbi:hypothetical protein CPB83DRAFT_848650 [Crepidotus variabilis]|uniref:Uncharacterized protein n=1 Tax=Crepidotus variabilis TaxID=179855 RepID=A0A9P6ENB2_9AGAR|nr:hypothetical protein CPB83DRAFT_848650 [Crepidotus variabilis]
MISHESACQCQVVYSSILLFCKPRLATSRNRLSDQKFRDSLKLFEGYEITSI